MEIHDLNISREKDLTNLKNKIEINNKQIEEIDYLNEELDLLKRKIKENEDKYQSEQSNLSFFNTCNSVIYFKGKDIIIPKHTWNDETIEYEKGNINNETGECNNEYYIQITIKLNNKNQIIVKLT